MDKTPTVRPSAASILRVRPMFARTRSPAAGPSAAGVLVGPCLRAERVRFDELHAIFDYFHERGCRGVAVMKGPHEPGSIAPYIDSGWRVEAAGAFSATAAADLLSIKADGVSAARAILDNEAMQPSVVACSFDGQVDKADLGACCRDLAARGYRVLISEWFSHGEGPAVWRALGRHPDYVPAIDAWGTVVGITDDVDLEPLVDRFVAAPYRDRLPGREPVVSTEQFVGGAEATEDGFVLPAARPPIAIRWADKWRPALCRTYRGHFLPDRALEAVVSFTADRGGRLGIRLAEPGRLRPVSARETVAVHRGVNRHRIRYTVHRYLQFLDARLWCVEPDRLTLRDLHIALGAEEAHAVRADKGSL